MEVPAQKAGGSAPEGSNARPRPAAPMYKGESFALTESRSEKTNEEVERERKSWANPRAKGRERERVA